MKNQNTVMGSLLCAALALTGCATVNGTNTIVNTTESSMSQQFKIGVSTKKDVLKVFGEPTQTVHDDADEYWVYSHVESKVDATTFIPIAGLFKHGTHADSKTVQFKFNKAGIVTDMTLDKIHL